jgi:ATP-dependent Clp protease ATP-binding subunit ClpA
VDKFILELEAQLELKDVEISVSMPAREWLAEQGFDPEMGARPMKRVIQNQIKRQLADDLLFGDLSEGGEVDVSLSKKDGKKLKIRTKPRQEPQKALPASTEVET